MTTNTRPTLPNEILALCLRALGTPESVHVDRKGLLAYRATARAASQVSVSWRAGGRDALLEHVVLGTIDGAALLADAVKRGAVDATKIRTITTTVSCSEDAVRKLIKASVRREMAAEGFGDFSDDDFGGPGFYALQEAQYGYASVLAEHLVEIVSRSTALVQLRHAGIVEYVGDYKALGAIAPSRIVIDYLEALEMQSDEHEPLQHALQALVFATRLESLTILGGVPQFGFSMMPEVMASRIRHLSLGSAADSADLKIATLFKKAPAAIESLILHTRAGSTWSQSAGESVLEYLRTVNTPSLQRLICLDDAIPAAGFLAELLQRGPKLRVVIVGTGPARSSFNTTVSKHEEAFEAWAKAIESAPAGCMLERFEIVTPGVIEIEAQKYDYARRELIKPAVVHEGPIATAQLDGLADACRRRGIAFKASLSTCVVASSRLPDSAAIGATQIDAIDVLAGRFERLFACPRWSANLFVYTALDAPLCRDLRRTRASGPDRELVPSAPSARRVPQIDCTLVHCRVHAPAQRPARADVASARRTLEQRAAALAGCQPARPADSSARPRRGRGVARSVRGAVRTGRARSAGSGAPFAAPRHPPGPA